MGFQKTWVATVTAVMFASVWMPGPAGADPCKDAVKKLYAQLDRDRAERAAHWDKVTQLSDDEDDDDDDDAYDEAHKQLMCTGAKLNLNQEIESMELSRETKTICGSDFAPGCDSACQRAKLPEWQEGVTKYCGDSGLSDATKARLEKFDRGSAPLVAGAIPSQAADQCPCKYKAPGQNFVTSRNPISEAHAKCAEPVDKYLTWLKGVLPTADGIATMVMPHMFNALVGKDYSIPPREESEEWVKTSTEEFTEAASEAGMTSALSDLAKKRAPARTDSGEVDKKDVGAFIGAFQDALEREMSRSRSSLQLSNEDSLQRSAALLAYHQCLLDNNLPPAE